MTVSGSDSTSPPGYEYRTWSRPPLRFAVMHRSGPPTSSTRCQSPLVIARHACSSFATRSSSATVVAKCFDLSGPTASCMPASFAIFL